MPLNIFNKIGNVGRTAYHWGINKLGSIPGSMRAIDRIAQVSTQTLPFLGKSIVDMLPISDGAKEGLKFGVKAFHTAREISDSIENKNLPLAAIQAPGLAGNLQAFAKSRQTGMGIPYRGGAVPGF
jgi:hypothetical protein